MDRWQPRHWDHRANLYLVEEMRRYNQVASIDEQLWQELNSEVVDL